MTNVRFATIGTSAITERFLDAVAALEGVTYVAAYSRSLECARAFGEPHGATVFFDSLDELAASDQVDAVYIATPNGLHAPQAKMLVAAGKHVLVEKAFAANQREATEVFDAADQTGAVCLEAMRNLYTEGFANIERTLGECGKVSQATFRFGKVTSRIKRLLGGEYVAQFDPALAEGALMDIGVYSVEPAVALIGAPRSVQAAGVTTQVSWDAPAAYRTIDLSGSIVLSYEDKVVDLAFSKIADDLLESQIAGEGGTLHWGEPSTPRDVTFTRHEDKGMIYGNIGGTDELLKSHDPENDMQCELAVFVGAIRGDEDALARVARARQITLGSLAIMDEARRQMGVRFPVDDE